MSAYNIFILLVFNRECMERNVMTSFRILSSFECFLRYFQTRITTTKFLKFSNLHSLNLNNLQRSRRCCSQRRFFFIQKTNASVLNIFTCCFVFLFMSQGLKNEIFSFFREILEHLHFCLANHACVSHLLSGQPHLLECYYRNCLIGAHVCTSSIRMTSFFNPSV